METENIMSLEYMEAMAALMAEALDSPEGIKALAAAIAHPRPHHRKTRSHPCPAPHPSPPPKPQRSPRPRARWCASLTLPAPWP